MVEVIFYIFIFVTSSQPTLYGSSNILNFYTQYMVEVIFYFIYFLTSSHMVEFFIFFTSSHSSNLLLLLFCTHTTLWSAIIFLYHSLTQKGQIYLYAEQSVFSFTKLIIFQQFPYSSHSICRH